MGLFRVFKKSIRFTVRSKRRFIVFLMIFAIVSSFVAFFVDGIDTMQTDDFLDQKSVVLKEFGEFSVSYNQSDLLMDDILDLPDNGKSPIEDSAIYHYLDLDQSLRIFSIMLSKPWLSSGVNPSMIQTGRFPRTTNEVLVPDGSFQIRNSSTGIILKSDVVVGQTIEFINNEEIIELKVVGTFDNAKITIPLDLNKKLWLFMDFTIFEKIIDLYGNILDEAYTYSMSFIVPGTILNPATYDALDQLNADIREIIDEEETSNYGSWLSPTKPGKDLREESYKELVFLGFAIIGGIFLSLMFSYLISRFRRREIAVLKALGYSNPSVRAALIGEIITTSSVGFVIGLGTAQGLIFFISDYSPTSLLRGFSMLYSFLINVVIAVPGMFLISRRVLKISPAEAFRDK